MQELENVEAAQYEAPAIESVVTQEDIEREVAYAGRVAISDVP
jgi:hypothetical protein